MQGRKFEVIHLAENGKEDWVQDFVGIVTSFCARLYGQRRSKRKTERILAELRGEESDSSLTQCLRWFERRCSPDTDPAR